MECVVFYFYSCCRWDKYWNSFVGKREARIPKRREIPQSGITVCRRADNSWITIVFYPWICFTIIVPRINPGSRCPEMEKNGEAFARRTRLDAATAKKRNGGALNQKRIRTLRTRREPWCAYNRHSPRDATDASAKNRALIMFPGIIIILRNGECVRVYVCETHSTRARFTRKQNFKQYEREESRGIKGILRGTKLFIINLSSLRVSFFSLWNLE